MPIFRIFAAAMAAALVASSLAPATSYARKSGRVEVSPTGGEAAVLEDLKKEKEAAREVAAEERLQESGKPGGGGFDLIKEAEEDAAAEAGGETFSLAKCIDLSLERNQKLKGSVYEVEAAQGQYTESKALFMPVLEYQWRIAPVPTDVNDAFNRFFDGQLTLFNGVHVAVGMPIGTFGQLQSAKHMAKNGVEAAKTNQVKAGETVRFQVKQLYYGVLFAKEMSRLLEDAVDKIGGRIASEEAKEENRLDPYDLLKLKATKVDLERRLAETEQNLELAYEGLRVNMDLEPGTPIVLDNQNLKPEIVSLSEEQEYVDAGLMNQPESKLVDIGVDTKRLQYRLEKFKLMPQAGFAFFADVGRTTGYVAGITATGDYNDPFNYTRAGIGVQLKGTLDFHGAYGRIKKARAEYYKATYDRLIAKRGLALELRKAYLNARRARDDVARARKADSISRQMAFMQKINQDMGIGDNQRYGDALMLMLLQRGYYFKSIYDYNIALADLAQKVTLAQYDKLTPIPEGREEYEAFDTDDDEGFETYGLESTSREETPAGWEPALRMGVSRTPSSPSNVDFEPRRSVSAPDSSGTNP